MGLRSLGKKSLLKALFFFLALVPFFCYGAGATSDLFNSHQTVKRVIDGDTFELATGDRVRLIGVNSPEHQPWRNHSQPFGEEASLFAQKILTGKKVTLEQDQTEKDKYNRTLAYVYLESGIFVNELLVAEGYAKARYYPPNGRYRQKLKLAENAAKKSKKGLWA